MRKADIRRKIKKINFIIIILSALTLILYCSKKTDITFKPGVLKMETVNVDQYKIFDREEISAYLFHPRKDTSWNAPGIKVEIPVEKTVNIGAILHHAGENYPFILFFHGNGEIASDYSDLAPFFTKNKINFMIADYRGYGNSTGRPSASSMIQDSHVVFAYTKQLIKEKGYKGKFIIMGRSLGSASALEIAVSHPDEIDALIIESGFADLIPLLNLLGINTAAAGITEDKAFMHTEKISKCKIPTLIIHAEKDHIIPYDDGRSLFINSGAKNKKMLTIPHANHNTIFAYGMEEYMNAVRTLANSL
jgi:alpha-beta hydrolase superfamily lysophospholipase